MDIGSSSKRGLSTSSSSKSTGWDDDDDDGDETYNKKTRKRYKKKNKKKKKGEKEMAASPVQNLYEICREVFSKGGGAGYIPPPNDLARIKSFLDGMRAEDFNLAPDMEFFRGTNNGEEAAHPVISYLHIHECSKFSIGIFCLPPSAVIPLHDHPSMTVFSKLLCGSLRVKSYDWVDNNYTTAVITSDTENPDQIIRNQTQRRIRLAKVHVDSDFTAPCETSVLFPAAGGNMHCFRAVTPCAILDVLGPPYSKPEGRNCTYYQDFPFSRFSGTAELAPGEDRNEYAWLEEIEKPEQFVVV